MPKRVTFIKKQGPHRMVGKSQSHPENPVFWIWASRDILRKSLLTLTH